jgi:hypothetical protein
VTGASEAKVADEGFRINGTAGSLEKSARIQQEEKVEPGINQQSKRGKKSRTSGRYSTKEDRVWIWWCINGSHLECVSKQYLGQKRDHVLQHR